MGQGRVAMSTPTSPTTWHWPWVLLAVYAGVSALDYGLTLTALTQGRMSLSPTTTGRPYEGNPLVVRLFTHEGVGAVLGYKMLAVDVCALLLLVSRPMWVRYAWGRDVTGVLLGAAVAWRVLAVLGSVRRRKL